MHFADPEFLTSQMTLSDSKESVCTWTFETGDHSEVEWLA